MFSTEPLHRHIIPYPLTKPEQIISSIDSYTNQCPYDLKYHSVESGRISLLVGVTEMHGEGHVGYMDTLKRGRGGGEGGGGEE